MCTWLENSFLPRVARRWLAALACATSLGCTAVVALAQVPSKFAGVGRVATPAEVVAWDIDVRADFKGLPAGSGSVNAGQDIWEAKCASCHGFFGESNQMFSPLVGGTTAADLTTGQVKRLQDAAYPGRTTLMKLASLSTLWDYIRRAMPWTQPKTLTNDEVYAVTAFMLNLGGVVADDFVLSDKNMAAVQAKLPNRNGMVTQHSLWPGAEFGGTTVPDTRNTACMNRCADAPRVASSLPDFARNAHGNLALQNRLIGPQRGANTELPEDKTPTPWQSIMTARANAEPAAAPAALRTTAAEAVGNSAGNVASNAPSNAAAIALATRHYCMACHGMAQKLVGPTMSDIAKKYANQPDYLAGKIRSGGSGVWGAIPMPAQTLPEADARTIAAWLAAGAKK